MPDPRALAQAYGLRVEIDDLGDWHPAALVSEYDPAEAVIRINRRVLEALADSCAVRDTIDRAIAHELHHHREAIGEVEPQATYAKREAAAHAYAEFVLRQQGGDGPSAAASRPSNQETCEVGPAGRAARAERL